MNKLIIPLFIVASLTLTGCRICGSLVLANVYKLGLQNLTFKIKKKMIGI